jgi:hypothetical protein
MAPMWPDYKFILGNQKPLLYIGGFKLLFNKMTENKNGDKMRYFYCVNKSSAQAIFCQATVRLIWNFVFLTLHFCK